MKQKLLASIICSLFIGAYANAHNQGIENGKDNIAVGDTAVAVGNGNISIGSGAVAVGNGMTAAQIEAALKEQQTLINEISSLKSNIKSNEAKNQAYLDTVDKVERNQQIIADLQVKLDASNAQNSDLVLEYAQTKDRYTTQKAIIDDKRTIISQLDLSKITANWETEGGLDALAKEFKDKAESGSNFSFGDDFYKDYLKQYVNVSTKVDHEAKLFDSVKGTIGFRTSGDNVSITFTNATGTVYLTEEFKFAKFGSHINDSVLVNYRSQTEKAYSEFQNNFDAKIQALKNSDSTLSKLWMKN